MKKIIIALFICFVVASPVRAETAQEQYVSALKQVILLLQQQVNLLIQQLNALQLNPPTSPVALTVITPATQPVLGVTEPTPTTTPTPTPTPAPAPIPVVSLQPVISNVSIGFHSKAGDDALINRLEFTSDQDVTCYNGPLPSGNTLTKHCVIEGSDAEAKIRSHLNSCNTTLDKSFYIFSTNQIVDPSKSFTCKIVAKNANGMDGYYTHTFTVPANN